MTMAATVTSKKDIKLSKDTAILKEYRRLINSRIELANDLRQLELSKKKAMRSIERVDRALFDLKPEITRIKLNLLVSFCNTPTWRYNND